MAALRKDNSEQVDKIAKRLGQVLAQTRESVGLTQEALADRANCHRTYVGAVERGEKNITVATLTTLATALETSASKLIAEAGL